jgi:hypothetical protein
MKIAMAVMDAGAGSALLVTAGVIGASAPWWVSVTISLCGGLMLAGAGLLCAQFGYEEGRR